MSSKSDRAIRRAHAPVKGYSVQEYAEMHGVTDSRIRQLIYEKRLYPAPRKFGKGYVIAQNTIIMRPPERSKGFDKIGKKLKQGHLTHDDVEAFIAEARHWIDHGVG